MNELFAILMQLKPWHWLSFGIILLVIDSLLTGGFLLGAAIAALLVWLLMLLVPALSWPLQFALFAVCTLIFSALYKHLFKAYNERTDVHLLNNRAAQMIGRQLTLEAAIPQGRSKIQIGDTLWTVMSDAAYPAGTRVEITSAEDSTLFLRQV